MNKKLLVTLVIIALTFFYVLPQVFATEFFSIIADVYRNDTVKLKSFEIRNLEGVVFERGEGDYSFVLFSNDKKLYENKMIIEFEAMGGEVDEQGNMRPVYVTVDPQEVYVRLPHYENATKVEIYHLDNRIFTYEICNNNNQCEPSIGENTINCLQDCPTTTTIPVPKPSTSIYIYLIIIVIIIAVIAVFFLRRIKIVR